MKTFSLPIGANLDYEEDDGRFAVALYPHKHAGEPHQITWFTSNTLREMGQAMIDLSYGSEPGWPMEDPECPEC